MSVTLRTFIFVALISVLSTIAGSLISPIEVRFVQSLTNNTTLIGITYAAGALFFSLLSLYLGRLSDRIGRVKFIQAGLLVGIVYPLLYASSHTVFIYMGVKLPWAFSSVALGPILMAYVQDLVQDARNKGQLIGNMYAAQSVAGSVASFFGGMLADAYGLRAPYIAMACVFALALGLAFFVLRKDHVAHIHTTDTAKEKEGPLAAVRYLFSHPALVFYLFEMIPFSISWGIKGMLWPLVIFSLAGKNIYTGSIFATMGVVAFVCLLFFGKLTDTIGPVRSLLSATVLLLVSGLALTLFPSLWVFWIAAGVFAAGEALHGTSEGVLLTEYVPSHIRGEILSLNAILSTVIGAATPLLAGVLLGYIPPQQVLLMYMSLFGIALVGQLWVYHRYLKV